MNYFKNLRWTNSLVFLLAFTFIFCLSANSFADKELSPSGNIRIDDTQVSFIVGGSWGKGVLSYKGVDYEFKIKGLKVGAIGISKVSAVGNVYNMNDLSKFSGTYVAGQAGIALAGGVGGTVLENQHKVYIRLRSTQQGVALNLGIDGLTIDIKDAIGPSR